MLIKTAKKELGNVRQTLQGDALSLEVLCAKFMKRKTLYCCTADPQKPVSRAWDMEHWPTASTG